MSNILEYKCYIGRVEFSADDKVFHGKIRKLNPWQRLTRNDMRRK